MTHRHAPLGSHDHLWLLPDGTGLHAPFGEMVREEGTGRLCCHYCGRWFTSLGTHLKVHGTTADEYRVDLGLPRTQPLTSMTLSSSLSERQRVAYHASQERREQLNDGQDLARNGTLSRLRVAKRRSDPMPASSVELRRQGLERGRVTRARERAERLDAMLRTTGHGDLHSYLRHRYAEGASLEALAQETGLGRDRLRDSVLAAGIELRRVGQMTHRARRSRAETADAEAATRIGTDDLIAWLVARRREGWSLTRLAAAVGHTRHWVRWRLESHEGAEARPG